MRWADDLASASSSFPVWDLDDHGWLGTRWSSSAGKCSSRRASHPPLARRGGAGSPSNDPYPADVARHDCMVALVEQMLDLNRRLAAAKAPHEKEVLAGMVNACRRSGRQPGGKALSRWAGNRSMIHHAHG